MHATHRSIYCLKPTAHALCGFVQVGNGKNRKEVERKFSTHTHTNWHMNRSISKLALICICCSICCVHLTKFKTLFAVSQCDVHCISGQYYCLPFLRYSFSMQNVSPFPPPHFLCRNTFVVFPIHRSII